MPSDISHDSVMYSSPADIIMNIIHCEGFILKSLMSIVFYSCNMATKVAKNIHKLTKIKE